MAGGVLGTPASSPRVAEGSRPEIGDWDPDKPQVVTAKKLVVQPLLRHELESWKPQQSWRNWGGVHTKETVAEEVQRISRELQQLAADAEFPLEILPVATASTDAEGANVRDSSSADVLILYAAGATFPGPLHLRETTQPHLRAAPLGARLRLVRERQQPVPQNAGQRLPVQPGPQLLRGLASDDIVVDDYQEILWRLRALSGVKNFLGSRAVTIGKASGKGCPRAPELCRTKYQMDLVEVPYADLEKRIALRREDAALHDAKARQWTKRYVTQPNVTLKTHPQFVHNCFLLYTVFKDLMREHNAQSLTIQGCMRTVMPIAETTACLSLSLLQDEGYIAFCESDFSCHPAGVLLRYVSGRPVFMHNPTFPHNGVVTCAHCACPRRMDGARYEPLEILTHYESDYGAATKVLMAPGTEVTIINPDYAASAMARLPRRRGRQPLVLHLPLATGHSHPGRLEEARSRNARLPLDDGLRRLPKRDGVLHAEDRTGLVESLRELNARGGLQQRDECLTRGAPQDEEPPIQPVS